MSGTDSGEQERLMTPGEVAALFRVHVSTVARWATEGRLGAIVTPGGHRRFDRAALEQMVAARRSGGKAPMTTIGATPERLSRAYRRSYASPRSVVSTGRLDAPDREAFRGEDRKSTRLNSSH